MKRMLALIVQLAVCAAVGAVLRIPRGFVAAEQARDRGGPAPAAAESQRRAVPSSGQQRRSGRVRLWRGPEAEPIFPLPSSSVSGRVPGVDRVNYGMAQWPPPVESLSGLCLRSDTVVVGRVVRIVRQGAYPGSDSLWPRTLYRFRVEQYLRADGAPTRPELIDVWESGGVLNVESGGGVTRLACVMFGNPLLNVGERYLLFVHVARIDIPAEGGGVLTPRGTFRAADRIRAKIRLVNGMTAPASDPFQRIPPWEFEQGGGTLVGLPEAEAIERVRRALAETPFYNEPGVY